MKIQILGAGREVGKSAISLESKNTSLLLDYGMKVATEAPIFPPMPENEPDGAIISHAHLDHSGALPQLYRKWKVPAFMTDVSLDLVRLLIKDSLKIAGFEGYKLPYNEKQLRKAIKFTRLINYGELFRVGGAKCMLYDAGHIPGSAAVFVNDEKNVLYTGDIQTENTRLSDGAKLPKKTDVLITESTYAEKPHIDRKIEEGRLIETVEAAIANDTQVLLPTFAVGRAQEVLLILKDYAKYIALDGMAKKATRIVSSYSYRIKDAKALNEISKKITWVKNEHQRTQAMKKSHVIISSAGMLGGGPGVAYLRKVVKNEDNDVMFTGYQVEGTPGWNILKNGVFEHENEKFDIKCKVNQVELSAHAGKKGLLDIIERTKPETVICVHGESCENYAKELQKKGINAFAPKNGEEIRV